MSSFQINGSTLFTLLQTPQFIVMVTGKESTLGHIDKRSVLKEYEVHDGKTRTQKNFRIFNFKMFIWL